MRKRVPLLLALILPLACCTPRRSEDPGDLPVVVVNGDAYTARKFADDIGRKLKNFDALAAKDPINVRRAKERAIREFIISELLHQYAKQHKIEVTPADVDAEFERVRKSYPDDLTFKASLASEGKSIEQWRQSLKTTLMERKVFAALDPQKDDSRDTADARKYYDAHKQEFQHGPQVKIQQIVVAKEDDAERLLQKIKKGASFAEMAKKFSISPDAANGGELGYLTKGDVPAFDVAFDMKTGQLSGVVKSSYGFHIIKVLDKRPQGFSSFEQVRPRLLRRLAAQRQQKAFETWLDGAIKNAKIERNDILIEKISVHTEGAQE